MNKCLDGILDQIRGMYPLGFVGRLSGEVTDPIKFETVVDAVDHTMTDEMPVLIFGLKDNTIVADYLSQTTSAAQAAKE